MATANVPTTLTTTILQLWEGQQRDASRCGQLSRKGRLLQNIGRISGSQKQDEGNEQLVERVEAEESVRSMKKETGKESKPNISMCLFQICLTWKKYTGFSLGLSVNFHVGHICMLPISPAQDAIAILVNKKSSHIITSLLSYIPGHCCCYCSELYIQHIVIIHMPEDRDFRRLEAQLCTD